VDQKCQEACALAAIAALRCDCGAFNAAQFAAAGQLTRWRTVDSSSKARGAAGITFPVIYHMLADTVRPSVPITCLLARLDSAGPTASRQQMPPASPPPGCTAGVCIQHCVCAGARAQFMGSLWHRSIGGQVTNLTRLFDTILSCRRDIAGRRSSGRKPLIYWKSWKYIGIATTNG